MTDTQLIASTESYVEFLIFPYRAAIETVYSIAELKQLVPLVFHGLSQELITELNLMTNVDDAKNYIINRLKHVLVRSSSEETDYQPNNLTPWDLRKFRDEPMTRLFGQRADKLPIKVVIGQSTFDHLLTEEQTFGIVVGLENIPNFTFSLENIPINIGTFIKHREFDFNYVATVNGTEYGFDSPDFIQGVSTAALWTNRDVHTLVTSIQDENDNQITF